MSLEFEGWQARVALEATPNTQGATEATADVREAVEMSSGAVAPALEGLVAMNQSVEVLPLSENVFVPAFVEAFI